MCSKKKKIIIVDDDLRNQRILENLLEDDFTLFIASSGEECLRLSAQEKPDLILLDIMMPGINGYETCIKLKQDSEMNKISVIFVSGKNSLEERMQGFDVGADDYFVKPFDHDQLILKINYALKLAMQRSDLLSKTSTATKMALQAMKDTSKLGIILRFIDDSYKAHTIEDIAIRLFNTTQALGWSCSASIKVNAQTHYLSDSGMISSLEKSLLEQLKGKGRFFDFRNRTIVNFDHVSLLIKNMPVDNEVLYGTIKDHVCFFASGVDVRIQALMASLELEKQQNNLLETIEAANNSMNEIRKAYHHLRVDGARIVEDLKDDVDDLIIGFGLTLPQEEALTQITEKGISKTSALFNSGIGIDSSFERLINKLNEVSEA